MKLSSLVAVLLGALVAREASAQGPAEVASVRSMTGRWLLNKDKDKPDNPVQIGQILHERNVITFGGGDLSLGGNPKLVVTDLGGAPLDTRSCNSWDFCSPVPLVIPTIKSNPFLRNVSAVYILVMNALFGHQDASTATISKGIACGSGVKDDIAWSEPAHLNLGRVLNTATIPGGGDAALHFLAYPRTSSNPIDLTAPKGWAESIPVGLNTMTCNNATEVYWVLVLRADRAQDAAAGLDKFRGNFHAWGADVDDARRLTRGYLISIASGQPN
jgi:hypothetical protein